MLKTLFSFCFIAAWFLGFSQEQASLSGTVTDKLTGDPLQDVEILLNPGFHGAISDPNGKYSLDIPPGKYEIVFSYVGFSRQSRTIVVKEGEDLTLNVSLQREVHYLDEVEITGVGSGKTMHPVQKISRMEIRRSAVADVGEKLRGSANINGIRKGGTSIDPVIRGFKYDQLNVMADQGLKIEGGCPNRMDPATAHIDIDEIESIEILKGPYVLRYGPSFGGIVNLNTYDPVFYDKFRLDVKAFAGFESNWNGFREKMSVSGSNSRWYLGLSGGRKEYGDYTDGNGNEVNSSFRKYFAKGTAGFKPSKNQTIVASHSRSYARDFSFPALPMDEREDNSYLSSVDYSATRLSNTISALRVKLYHADVNHVMDNKSRPFSDTVVAISTIDAVNKGYRAELTMNSGNVSIITGTDLENTFKDGKRVKNMTRNVQQDGSFAIKEEKLWNNAYINNYGLFSELSYDFGTSSATLSVRLDYNFATSDDIFVKINPNEDYLFDADSTDSEHLNFSFSLGWMKEITENFSTTISAGRGVRSPGMIERFIIMLPIGYDKFDYLGNPGLEPEVNYQADLGFDYKPDDLGSFHINGFFSIISDYITGKRLPASVQKPLSKDVLGVKEFQNVDQARLTGFEISYASPVRNKIRGTLRASYTYGVIPESVAYTVNESGEVVDEVIINNDAMPEIPPMEGTATIEYSFLHNRLIPELKYRLVAAQEHLSEAYDEERTPGFGLLDFKVSWQINSSLFLTTGVKNIFDKAYYEHLNRNIIGSYENFYEPGRVFFINTVFEL